MNQALIKCQSVLLNKVKDLGFDYTIDSQSSEVNVIVPEIDYNPNDYYVSADEQLCNYYGLNYFQVNCIELI